MVLGSVRAEKSAINTISQLISVSDWSIIMIGSGGLLLVIICHPNFSFMGGVAKESK
jgi:hypothetical protein